MVTLLERSNSTNPGMLRVMALCHESCKVLSEQLQVPLPDSTQLASHVAYLEGMMTPTEKPTAPTGTAEAVCHAKEAIDRSSLKSEVREFVALCDSILDDLDEMPDKAEEFTESVREKVSGMRETASTKNFATAKMIAAAENMRGGVDRWLHRD